MSYRDPNKARMSGQTQDVFKFAGQTALWRQWISADAGVPAAGIGPTPYYREQLITGLFAPLPLDPETQTPAGMIQADAFMVTTRERIEEQDELLWRGETYRIESDPMPAAMPGLWMALVKRGDS